MNAMPVHPPIDVDAPLPQFANCHHGIIDTLQAAVDLPRQLQLAAQARKAAADLVQLFDHGVVSHHADEEQELFPAVQRSAAAGGEAESVNQMVQQLIAEHRFVERLWKQLAPEMRKAARGAAVDVNAELLADLIGAYADHARFEEQHFLPLAQAVLGRNGNHMSALGLSLHMRHVTIPTGYV